MAKTYTQFMTYIKNDFKRDDKDTEIAQAYNDTIRHLSGMRALEGLVFTSYIYTVIGQEDYPLPSAGNTALRIHVIHPIRIIESTTLENGYPLNKLDRGDWARQYINPNNFDITKITKGMPTDYCIFSNAIHIGPVPDKNTYIIEIDWAKLSSTQEFPSDLQELGEAWEEVIKWGTLFRLYTAIGLDSEASKYAVLYKDDEFGYPYLTRQEGDRTNKMGVVENRNL